MAAARLVNLVSDAHPVPYTGPKGTLYWSESECYDCSGCVGVCPFHALEIRDGTIIADMTRCTLCTLCERVCPTAAFSIDRHKPNGEAEVVRA